MKVRTSQIPEESGKVKRIKTKKSEKPKKSKGLIDYPDSDEEEEDDMSYDANKPQPIEEDSSKEEEEKKTLRLMLNIPECDFSISLFGIETIEKSFKIIDSNWGGDNVKAQYGIVINKDMEPSIRYPRTNIEFWWDKEEIRDQRYKKIMSQLEKAGYKFV